MKAEELKAKYMDSKMVRMPVDWSFRLELFELLTFSFDDFRNPKPNSPNKVTCF